ncbi:MAG: hypothetical protein ACR2IE_09150 [Candidatus Sumerlaeaceae bacterium]
MIFTITKLGLAINPIGPSQYHQFTTNGQSADEQSVFQGFGSIDVDHRFADLNDSLNWLIPIQGPGTVHVGIDIAGQFDIKYRLQPAAFTQGPRVSDALAGTQRRSWRHFNVVAPAGVSQLELRMTDFVPTDGFGPSVWHIEISIGQTKTYVFDGSHATTSDRIAGAAVQGILNRAAGTNKYFMLHNDTTDLSWLGRLQVASPQQGFVHMDYQEAIRLNSGLISKQILYNADGIAVPVAISLAGLHSAVPVVSSLGLTTQADIRGLFSSNIDAMDYLTTNVLPTASRQALAVLNPQKSQPVDYFTDKSMLVCWFNNTVAEKNRFKLLVNDPHFVDMVDVMGYIEADEVASHFSTRGAISLVSDLMPNLSFLSRMSASTAPRPNSPRQLTPNPSKRYYALVVSDGDNLQFIWNAMSPMIDAGVQNGTFGTFPLSFTFSNRLRTLAPFVHDRFYTAAKQAGPVDFLMGPSGYGYLHPTLNPYHASFVTSTSLAAQSMITNCYVHWDEYNKKPELEQTVAAYNGSAVAGVLCPILPQPAEVVNGVVTFPEIHRLSATEALSSAAAAINGSASRYGYIYVIWSQSTSRIRDLKLLLASDIELVTAREMVGIRRTELGLPPGYPAYTTAAGEWAHYR